MKLNLGCGHNKMNGYINIDIMKEYSPDLLINLEKAELPFKDNEITKIFSSHTLEHISPTNYIKLLKEMYRVSKNGAIWELILPFDSPSSRCHPFHFRTYHYGSFSGFVKEKSYRKAKGNINQIILKQLNNPPNRIRRMFALIYPESIKELKFVLKVIK